MPDFWGWKISQEAFAEKSTKVARDAELVMGRVDDDMAEGDNAVSGQDSGDKETDDEEDESDDEGDEPEEDRNDSADKIKEMKTKITVMQR